jgi:hypothetical protein
MSMLISPKFHGIPVVKVLKPKRAFWGRGNILYRSINAGRKSQAGTSHYLGQNFAKALMLFANEGKQEYVWGTLVFQQDYGSFSNDAF